MENKKTIDEFDMELISEYFSKLKRQGPGSPEMTVKALSFIDNLTEKSKITDIGCGTGGQTIVLAQNIVGNITGIDLFPDFIKIFNENVEKLDLKNRVNGIVGSMDKLPFQNEEFDLIWCEGAIYNIGFEQGLNQWRKYLKKNGFIAVTEASWYTEKRPSEIDKYWMHHYPAITTISNNVTTMQKSGYIPVSIFTLPENCWIDNYFVPQILLYDEFLKKYNGNKIVEEFIEGNRNEERMYQKYKEYYGYVFYIGKKFE
jgi:ubiquinone/menaquinone biosynthesis C-methylase UbiE